MTTQDKFIRLFKHDTEIVCKNNRFTTLVTFEFVPNKDVNNIYVYENYKKLFTAVKSVYSTTKIIASSVKIFENPNECSKGQNYITNFPMTNKLQQQ